MIIRSLVLDVIIVVVAFFGQYLTTYLVRVVKDDIDAKALSDPKVNIPRWLELTEGLGGPGGITGALERIAFFLALRHGYPLFIGAWLAFKVATKWETWSNVIQVPRDEEDVSLRLRRLLGGQVMASFLVGTLANTWWRALAS